MLLEGCQREKLITGWLEGEGYERIVTGLLKGC
jgi:hypothetical protein